MFNRQPLNRGGFNRPSGQSSGGSGISLLKLGTNAVAAMRTIAASGVSNLSMKQQSAGTVIKYSIGSAALALKATGKGVKNLIATASTSALVMRASANQTLSGEASITLQGLTLLPGDELVINTCDMTITLNGENASEYLDPDSEYFSLLSGVNTIEYTDESGSREVNLDIIWKDRWL